MYSISIACNAPGTGAACDIMRQIDPDGNHVVVQGYEEAGRIVKERQPDIVWLEADDDGLALADAGMSLSPQTNWIFIAGGTEDAYKAISVRASGYIIEPVTEEKVRREIGDLRHKAVSSRPRLRVQCFGNFEVFCNGMPVKFSRTRAKEALAYMIDRRGAACTVAEICSVLWESRVVDTSLKSQCRVILASLMQDLRAVGAGDAISKSRNSWSVNRANISCDYYDFLRDEDGSTGTYSGEYMMQYSWAEMTSGMLYMMANARVTGNAENSVWGGRSVRPSDGGEDDSSQVCFEAE